MKKILSVVLVLFLTLTLVSCKEYKYTECDSCGKKANCYKIEFVHRQNKSEYSYFVCSDKCEKFVTNICTFSGYVKK